MQRNCINNDIQYARKNTVLAPHGSVVGQNEILHSDDGQNSLSSPLVASAIDLPCEL